MKKLSLILCIGLFALQANAEGLYDQINMYAGSLSAVAFTAGVYGIARGRAVPFSRLGALGVAYCANALSLGANVATIQISLRDSFFKTYSPSKFEDGMITAQLVIGITPFILMAPITKPIERVIFK